MTSVDFRKADTEQWKNLVNNWMISPDNTDTQVWKLLVDVPAVHRYLAVGCAVLNVLLPGFGTAIAACGGPGKVSKVQLAVALM